MKYLLLLVACLLIPPSFSWAQNAVGVVVNTQTIPNQVQVSISVSESTGVISFGTSFNVNFASSTNQMNADIRQRIRDILIQYGINVPVNNIILFGGAQ